MMTRCPKCGYIQETYALVTKCRREGCGRVYKTAGRETEEQGNGTGLDGFLTAKEMRE